LNLVADILHIDGDILHVTSNTLYLPLDTPHSIVDAHHLPINAVRHLQLLGGCHPCLFLRQFVQSPQAILDVSVSRQLLQVLF
jgi:hypothetical protein